MAESIQKKLQRVRPPRVSITYDVEVGDAIEERELPFVMGVLADLSGDPAEELPRFADRKFTEITPDNFDDVLKSMKPHLAFTVDNKLSDDPDAGKIAVDLDFESLDDFSPEAVAEQVGPLSQLLDLRQQLADLRANLQGNQKLEEILQETLNDEEKLEKLQAELDALESEEDPDGEG